MDATREALSGGVARANRQPARVRSGRQGGGEACITSEAGNAGGGKEPQVRSDAQREKGHGSGYAYYPE